MVDLATQHQKISNEISSEINEVIQNSEFINGKIVKEFSLNLAKYLNSQFVIPCANGTDALQLALMALDLKAGDEILVPSFNYVSAVEVIALLGLTPIFVEVDKDSFNCSAIDIENKISSNTKAIIVVHLFGQCADMEQILQIAQKNNLFVIEDTAQSIGASYTFKDGLQKMAGTMGHIGTTSFFPSKNLGCMGDGGAVLTNDEKLASKINVLANHGQVKKYWYDEVGVNSRLDSMQAAILSVKLKYLNQYTEARQLAASNYDSLLKDSGVQLPVRSEFSSHVFNQYTIKVPADARESLQNYLKSQGIPTMIYYPLPLHLQTAYKKYSDHALLVSEELSTVVLSLPMHTELDFEQQSFISENLVVGLNMLRR